MNTRNGKRKALFSCKFSSRKLMKFGLIGGCIGLVWITSFVVLAPAFPKNIVVGHIKSITRPFLRILEVVTDPLIEMEIISKHDAITMVILFGLYFILIGFACGMGIYIICYFLRKRAYLRIPAQKLLAKTEIESEHKESDISQIQKPEKSILPMAVMSFGILSILFTLRELPNSTAYPRAILPVWERTNLVMIAIAIIFALICIGMGIISLRLIKQNRYLFNRNILILGTGLGVLSLALTVFMLCPSSPKKICVSRLHSLGVEIKAYSFSNDGKYPPPDKWYDSILPKGGSYSRKGQCYYAINPSAKENSPDDMVLLFESKAGWNQFGGPELLNTENHRGKGCNILFNSLRVTFVKKEDFDKLQWEP